MRFLLVLLVQFFLLQGSTGAVAAPPSGQPDARFRFPFQYFDQPKPHGVRSLPRRLAALEAKVQLLTDALLAETAARQAAEKALSQAIDTERSVRIAADAALEADTAGFAHAADYVQDLQAFVTVTTDTLENLAGPHVIIEGANVHVRSGSGATDDNGSLLGLGNLVVGYNEPSSAAPGPFTRRGSHNIAVGRWHAFTSFGGFVAGEDNSIAGRASSVSGGRRNKASGDHSSVSGGADNMAIGSLSSVAGGGSNTASGASRSTVCGGLRNTASGQWSTACGGQDNLASGASSTVSGGGVNEARGGKSTVTGGRRNLASGPTSVVGGGDENVAAGGWSVVSGGSTNMTDDDAQFSTVSGGRDRTAFGDYDWLGGGAIQDQ